MTPMQDTFEAIAKYGPQYLPIIVAIAVIVFTKTYVYKGMVPESMLKDQMEREKTFMREQADQQKGIIEGAKDIENRLEEIVRQLESLTKKVSEEIREGNIRITSLERYLSDQMGEMNDLTKSIQHLAFQCERHRKGIPETQVFLQERSPSS